MMAEGLNLTRTTPASLTRSELELVTSNLALARSLEATTFLEGVLNGSRDCIMVLSLEGDVLFINAGGQLVLEVDDVMLLHGRPWLSLWGIDHEDAARAALETARAGQTGHFTGHGETTKQTQKWWDVTITPIFGKDGKPASLLSISRDISAARLLELERELLANELSHRVKNVLAVVQAIALQSFRGCDPKQLGAFTSRLAALGTAQDLLIQTVWQSASIRTVVEKALAPHAPDGRCTFAGADHDIDGKRALALALALHEMATNAVKYGALSNDVGQVRIEWSVTDGTLSLCWTESNGPKVEKPGAPGFGTRIVTRNLAAEFGGAVDMQHKPAGIVLTLTAPF
ncbi:sensor histidine kinase [Sphingomonas sp. MMS24-J13]|uniref:sensor histidine kinase n=1 Tax=Sphingomonas sp. MMS24-J13 TaxID=3238686 RepID=UPI0038514DA0